MTADKQSPFVPKRRFPEFEDAGPWEQLTIDAVADLKNGYAFKSDTYVESGDFQIVTIGNVQEGQLDLESTKSIATLPRDIQDHQILKPTDILVSMTGNVGRVCLVSVDGLLLNQRVGKIIPRTIDHDFFFQTLNRTEFRSAMQLAAAGGAQGNVSAGEIRSFVFACPVDPKEQTGIADCLGSLDGLIAAEGRKLEALRKHKQGLMQQLFPQPGETVPRLRFPKFEHAPKWEEERLGNLVAIVSGKSPSQYALVAQGDCAFVKVEDLNNCSKYQVDGREYCNDVRDVVPSGSILFPKRGAAIENNKIRITASEILIDTNLMALTPRNTAATEFLYYYLVRVGLAQIADTSSIPQINNKHIIPYRVLVPSESEQHRIADCLSMLDARLTAQVQKLDALQTHKQGLLQQLFPSLDEQ